MRRLADQLGVAPNALYSHFADKGALLDALLDTLLAEVPAAATVGVDWREGLVAIMSDSRRLMLQHGDLIPHFLSRPGRGPNAIRLGEATLALLARGGVTGKPAVEALQILLIFTFGFVAYEAPRRADPAPARRRALGEKAFRAAEAAPRVRRAAADLARHADDATFKMGLRWLIAGVAGVRAGTQHQI